MMQSMPISAGSKILDGFVAPFDAAVVEKLLASDNISIARKFSMPEFGIGELFEKNPSVAINPLQILKEGVNCLCNDLFGWYRRLAAENDLCYIHPTYGTVSRYGLIQQASSMDQIGVLCSDMAQGFELLSIIAGKDDRDGAMFHEKKYTYQPSDKSLKIWTPANIFAQADQGAKTTILANFAQKFDVIERKFDLFDVCKQTMYILACAEISNNISRYDGVKYGYRAPGVTKLDEMYTKTRSNAFEFDTKLTAIIGSMVLSAGQYQSHYEKAMKIRRLVKKALNFDDYDVIALPTSIADAQYDNLGQYAIAQLAGLPSISFSHNGYGIQLIANIKCEGDLLTAWEALRQ